MSILPSSVAFTAPKLARSAAFARRAGLALAITALTSVTVTGCAKAPSTQVSANGTQAAATAQRVDIEAKQFRTLMAKKDSIILDVRTPGEWTRGRIANAQMINVHDGGFADKTGRLAKDKAILVYCASGRRSVTASTRLLAAGFTRVYNLKGGIQGWGRAGLPVDRSPLAAAK